MSKIIDNNKPRTRADALRTLGLPFNAVEAAIKKRARGLMLTSHPDKNTDDHKLVAAAKFRNVKEAYNILLGAQ